MATSMGQTPIAARIPETRTPLRGRDQDLGALRGLLAAGQTLVTVTGPGGVGKTRLAIALAVCLDALQSR